jgi:LuxR family transcriptional regulator, regulator of acetate metabolism
VAEDQGSTAGDDARICRALAVVRDTTGVPLAFGGTVLNGQQVRLTAFAGHTTGALRGVALDFGRGLGGKVVALRRPLAVNDYITADRISHDYDRVIAAEGLRAMVAAPVVVNGTVRAVLYGAIREALPLGDPAIRNVTDAARTLEQKLAVDEEVTRRLAWLDERANPPEGSVRDAPQWETVRAAYSELRVLAQRLPDDDLRQRVSSVCDRLAAAASEGDAQTAPVPALSPRELDVLACAAMGQRNAEIATDLGLQLETVKSYLRSAMRKLQCHSRLEAIVAARRYGLLP